MCKRLFVVTVAMVLGLAASAAFAQCCGSVEMGYAAPAYTTYYAPTVAYYPPAVQTVSYAPTATYYAPASCSTCATGGCSTCATGGCSPCSSCSTGCSTCAAPVAAPAPCTTCYAPAVPQATYYPAPYATYYAPAAYATYYAPACSTCAVGYCGRPGYSVFGAPRVYYAGQPVRNTLKAITP
ncbi:MAG: hypothetical protein ABFC96_18160 [Thermoguttaceae bacterium]